MTHTIRLHEEFGPRLSDGADAYAFRVSSIDPYLTLPSCDQIVLDFSGIRIANSSFVNALVSGLFEQHGETTLQKLVFSGCRPMIRVLVQSAVELGIRRHGERV